MKETFVLWMLLVAGVMIAVAIIGYYRAKRRREAMAAWADARGWSFTVDRDNGFEDRHGGFDCLRKGNNRYAYNISEGALNGRRAWTFDYHYETYSSSKHGRKTNHHYFSAVMIVPNILLKPLFIRPESYPLSCIIRTGQEVNRLGLLEFSAVPARVSTPHRR